MENFSFKYSESEDIISSVSFYHPDHKTQEAHLMIRSKPHLDTVQSWSSIQDELKRSEDELNFPRSSQLFLRVFCSDVFNQEKVLRANFPVFFDFPGKPNISFVQQSPMPGSKLAVWAYLVKGKSPVERGEFGNIYHSNGLSHIYTANLTGDVSDNACLQTKKMFLTYVDLLLQFKSCLLDNAIRTWVFVRDADIMYKDVAKARRLFFEKQGLNETTHYIASTGIEGKNEIPAVLSFMDTYTIAGINPGQVKFLHAPGFMCPTGTYGVTFERGTEISYGDRKHIFISGTASINQNGEILFPGDVVQQTYRTVENMKALLKEVGASLSDLVYALVYVRDISDYQIVHQTISEILTDVPLLVLHAPICRPAWLVEIEGMAICTAATEWPDF
jgi:enamine deaminase RidA (YjgF/YER057c/UK114 family)